MTMTQQMTIQADLNKVTVVVESVQCGTTHVYGSKPEVLQEEYGSKPEVLQQEYEWHEEYLEKMCGADFKDRHRNKGER